MDIFSTQPLHLANIVVASRKRQVQRDDCSTTMTRSIYVRCCPALTILTTSRTSRCVPRPTMTIRWLVIRSCGGASLLLDSWAGCSLTSNTSAGSLLCKITAHCGVAALCSESQKYVNAGPISKSSNKNRPSASVCPGNRCTSWLGPND